MIDVPLPGGDAVLPDGRSRRGLDLLDHDDDRRDRRPMPCTEGKRSIWEMGQVQVDDGGPDGVAATQPNTLFARQGVFVP